MLLADATAAAVSNPLGQVQQISIGLGGGPVAYVAGLAIIGCVSLGILLLRAKDRHLVQQAKMAEQYSSEIIKLKDEHLKTALMVVPVAQGLIPLVDAMRELAAEATDRRNRKLKQPPTPEPPKKTAG